MKKPVATPFTPPLPEPMSAEEFRTILLILGEHGKPLPQVYAANVFYVSVRTVANWCNGHTPIPPLAAEKARRLMWHASAGRDWKKHVGS